MITKTPPRKICYIADCPNRSSTQGYCARHFRERVLKRPVLTFHEGTGPFINCACGCNRQMHQFDQYGRPRQYLRGHFKSTLGKVSPIKGKPLPQEHRDKIRKARTGRPHPQIWTEERRKANSDKTRSMQIWKRSPVGRGEPPWNKDTKDEVYKAKMREKRLHQKFPQKDSKIEVALQRALKELNITFSTHKPIIGQPDIFIEPRLCVFADGNYWHSIPKAVIRDCRVNASLLQQGYTILRFSEAAINTNVHQCIQAILAATRNHAAVTCA